MTEIEIQVLFDRIETATKNGRYKEAEQLASEVLAVTEPSSVIHILSLIYSANAGYKRGDTTLAILLAEKASLLADEYNYKEYKAKANNILGSIYSKLSDYHQAIKHYEVALATNEEIGNAKEVAIVLGNIGIVYHNLSNYELVLEYSQKALVINEGIENNKYGVASNLGIIGAAYLSLSDYRRALEYFFKSCSMYEALGYKLEVADNLSNIGNVYIYLSDYPRALEYYQKALAINDELGSKNGIAHNLSTVGNVYSYLSQHSRALEYYQRALAIDEELGSKIGVAHGLGNIGSVYNSLQDYPLALEYFFKALAIDEEIGNKSGIAINLSNIGSAYNYLGEYSNAMEYFRRALAIDEELGIKHGIAGHHLDISELYATKNYADYNPTNAKEHLFKAISLYIEIEAKLELYECYKLLAELYEYEEQWKEAYINKSKYHTLEREVQSEEARAQAEQMEYRRQIEESERDRQVKLARFQEQEKILHNILPTQIADRMVAGEKTIVDSYESVSVLFADIVGFTKLSQRVTPEQLVAGLDGIFNTFDLLADKHGCEKIKTIGDCYMVVAGLPERCDNHAERLGAMALDMLQAIEEFPAMVVGVSINMRIGIHSGTVVAGIIGKNKYAYDLWGDAVNTASRMESHGEAGKIHVSEEFKQAFLATGRIGMPQASPMSPYFVERGTLDIKGKGRMNTYFLENTTVPS